MGSAYLRIGRAGVRYRALPFGGQAPSAVQFECGRTHPDRSLGIHLDQAAVLRPIVFKHAQQHHPQ